MHEANTCLPFGLTLLKGISTCNTFRTSSKTWIEKEGSISARESSRRTANNGQQITLESIYAIHFRLVPFTNTSMSYKTKESYIVCALLSYTRRYWRKALERKTKTNIALQLIAVLKANPRKARESCRKGKKRTNQGGFFSFAATQSILNNAIYTPFVYVNRAYVLVHGLNRPRHRCLEHRGS